MEEPYAVIPPVRICAGPCETMQFRRENDGILRIISISIYGEPPYLKTSGS